MRKSLFLFFTVMLFSWIVLLDVYAAPKSLLERKKAREAEQAKEDAETKAEVADIVPASMDGLPPEVTTLYAELEKLGNRGVVPICYQLALIYWDRGEYTEAARLLDLALLRITAPSAGDKNAQKARSTFHGEAEKIFRGEPYEQAFVYMIRGLLYMREGDYENARAIFRSGALCDRSSEEAPEDEHYNDDLAEMDYLEGLCNLKLNNGRAPDNFKVAREHARHDGAVMDPPEDFNTVVLLLSGTGPAKYATGEYAQFLRFKDGNGASGPVEMRVDNAVIGSVEGPLDNMTFQATTRGGREIDAILKGKAQFKTGASVVGDLALISGAAAGFADNTDAPGLGLGLAIIGIAAKGISAAANPAADTRMVPVPDDIYIFPMQLDTGNHSLTVACPETGVSESFSMETSPGSLNIVTLHTNSFPEQVYTQRYRSYNENKESLVATALAKWTGTIKEGKEEIPLTLFITREEGDNFYGFVEYKDSLLPCEGAIDTKSFRLEYSPFSNKSVQRLLTGKLRSRGKASSGDTYMISASGMAMLGSFKLSRIDEKTGKPAPQQQAGSARQSRSRRFRN